MKDGDHKDLSVRFVELNELCFVKEPNMVSSRRNSQKPFKLLCCFNEIDLFKVFVKNLKIPKPTATILRDLLGTVIR